MTEAREVLNLTFSPQWAFWTATERYVTFEGAARAGKTTPALLKVIDSRQAHPSSQWLRPWDAIARDAVLPRWPGEQNVRSQSLASPCQRQRGAAASRTRLERVAQAEAGRLSVVKVNTEDLSEVGDRFGVRSIPTIAVFAGGHEAGRDVGAKHASAIQAFVSQTLQGAGINA